MANSKTRDANTKPLPNTEDAIAVAIKKFDMGTSTPKVIAGGKGRVAEQILEIAFQNGVKVREDSDLVELLAAIDIDSEIPVEAFATVAEILIYLYAVNNKVEIKDSSLIDENGEICEISQEILKKRTEELLREWTDPEDDIK